MNGFLKLAIVIAVVFILAMAYFFRGNEFKSMKDNFGGSQSIEESLEISK